MSEQENAPAETASTETASTETAPESAPEQAAVPAEEITYHAVEKDGMVTAIWEMQGRKHLRTIDPRSRQGQEILRLYTSDHEHQDDAATAPAGEDASEAAST
jgi:hypothetical protein